MIAVKVKHSLAHQLNGNTHRHLDVEIERVSFSHKAHLTVRRYFYHPDRGGIDTRVFEGDMQMDELRWFIRELTRFVNTEVPREP